MIYKKQYIGEDTTEEISYEKALDTLLTTYKDNDITREMLKTPGEIPCRCSTVYVEADATPDHCTVKEART